MKKGWKMIGIIVLAVVVIGAVLTGIGFVTGADTSRIYYVLDDDYVLTEKIEWFRQVVQLYTQALLA